jgi:HPt (histidine-containing phosphotransfer) domain-containing protein
MVGRLMRYLVLPSEIKDFERAYLARMNRIGLIFFALHVPVYMGIAYFNDTGAWLTLALCVAVMIGPTLAYFTFQNPRHVSMTYGFTAMLMGGVLVHIGQGLVQIEMHFYFFALLAMLSAFGNPMVVVIAAVTVTLHHVLLWLLLPSSVFNYDAPLWVVGVHALFVVLESVATCFIARSFYDMTSALVRSQDMRLVLDHVDQGLVTVGRDGVMSFERSAIMDDWFGETPPNTKFASFLGKLAQVEGEMFEVGFDDVLSGFLPLDVTISQLPKKIEWNGRTFALGYTPIMEEGEMERLLVIMTDMTKLLEREQLEAHQRELARVFDQLMRDRLGFLEFMEETRQQLAVIQNDKTDAVHLKRMVHTLKGNSTIFGIEMIADCCHQLETSWVDQDDVSARHRLVELPKHFERVHKHVEAILGHAVPKRVELELDEYEGTLRAVLANENRATLASRMRDWTLEPTVRRLERIAEQAYRIADRLNKAPLRVVVRDNGLRLDAAKWASFWSAFVHVIRNAIDHGVETADERLTAAKSEPATIEIVTRKHDEEFVIEVRDNGRGLVWSKIAMRAESLGLPHDSHDDLIGAIFRDGFSTTTVATDYSGRGVGMGAVRAECEQRGGTMEVSSIEGKGTCIAFRFPESAMVAARQADAA